jgi:hypothetical protein
MFCLEVTLLASRLVLVGLAMPPGRALTLT